METTKNYIIEGLKIRKGTNLKVIENEEELKEIEESLKESFSGGSSASIAKKVVNVLGRKIGLSFEVSDIPFDYDNSYGSFKGYLARANNDLFVKINFLLGGSDTIVSFDVYLEGFDESPSYTIETEGLNIIEIVNLVTENLIEDAEVSEYALEEKVIKERSNLTNAEDIVLIIDKWVKGNKEVLSNLQKEAVPEIFSGVWQEFVEDKPNYQNIKFYIFSQALKQYLLSKGMTNKTYRKRKNGSKERPIEDPVLAAQFENILESISWEEKFNVLKGAIKAVVDGDIQALFEFGDPGSGKSYTTIETLDSLGVKYNLYKGGFKGNDELIRVLYNHREGEILCFDDADSSLQKTDINIWKAALENVPVRTITFVDTKRKGGMKDVPQKFEFSSGVIFISNDRKLNSAVASRALTLEITLSNAEVINKIEKTLSDFRPEVSLNVKKEALNYLQEISAGVRTVDYRVLDKVLIAMKISPSNWKKTALMFIKALD
jgi:hypothetical protein